MGQKGTLEQETAFSPEDQGKRRYRVLGVVQGSHEKSGLDREIWEGEVSVFVWRKEEVLGHVWDRKYTGLVRRCG